jgi:iron complex outermembrane receptor protein
VSVQTWINAGNTNTKGVDFVLNWKNKNLNLGRNGNLNTTKIDKIDTPSELQGVEIFSHGEQSLITNSRPKSKFSFIVDYALEKLEFGMYNTYFGEVTVANANENPELDQVMAGKLITDFRLTYLFTPHLKLTGIINNYLMFTQIYF